MNHKFKDDQILMTNKENDVIELISPLSLAYKIGSVIPGNKEVLIA